MINSIEIQRSLFSPTDFLSWMKAGQLNLSPNFQRRSVWNKSAKSYFIDTLVRGLPIPIVFLRPITDIETLKTTREVVDGQQRLRTIISFIDPSALPDFDEDRDRFTVRRSHNSEISGKPFVDLSDRIKKSILGYQISAHVLPTDTSDQQVLDIFRRMNATGTRLSPQELRNAKYFGYFSQVVNGVALTYLVYWRDRGVFGETNIAKMEEVEFTSKLFIVALSGVTERSQTQISSVYENYDDAFAEGDKISQRVTNILEIINDTAGTWLKSTDLSNKIIFYPMFAALYDIIYGIGSSVNDAPRSKKPDDLTRKLATLAEKFLNREALPEDVQDALISRSNRRSNRLALKDFILANLD